MNKFIKAGLLSLVCAVAAATAAAKEVPPGTVLGKSNIDVLLNDTLDGKPVGSLLSERMQWMVRNAGWTMKLVNAKPVEVDPKWLQTTQKNASGVQYDAKTRTVSGWKGGAPFPHIDPADPNAGDKVAWNARYSLMEGQTQEEPYVAVYLVDLDKGIERVQNWAYKRLILANRAGAANPAAGDGGVFARTLTFLTYPLDIRGVGIYSVRHNDTSKVDDKWVYVNQFRRVKRVSGGGWMDPLGGGVDMLVEDLNIWDTPPNWYPSVKLKSKRWILAVAHAGKPLDESKPKRTPAELPQQEIDKAPFINSLNGFEPREVFELEVTTADEHPYGKRVVYIDAQTFQAYHSEVYDRKGEFWKFSSYERAPIVGKDGMKGFAPLQGRTIDFKRRHATIWGADFLANDASRINESTINAEALERESGK